MEAFQRRIDTYTTNKTNIRGLIYNLCKQAVELKLQQQKDWDELQTNPFQLLKALREITHRYKDTQYYISTVATSI